MFLSIKYAGCFMCSKIGKFERYRAISRELLNAQTPDKYQHVAKSLQIPLMLISWRLQHVWRQYGKKQQIYHPNIDRIGLAHVQLRLSVFKAADKRHWQLNLHTWHNSIYSNAIAVQVCWPHQDLGPYEPGCSYATVHNLHDDCFPFDS